MARRKLKNKNIRKIARIGNRSLGVTLPIEILRELGWRLKQKVVIKRRGKTITIKDWPVRQARPALTLASRRSGQRGKPRRREKRG